MPTRSFMSKMTFYQRQSEKSERKSTPCIENDVKCSRASHLYTSVGKYYCIYVEKQCPLSTVSQCLVSSQVEFKSRFWLDCHLFLFQVLYEKILKSKASIDIHWYFYPSEDLDLGCRPQEISQLKTLPFKILPTLPFCYF